MTTESLGMENVALMAYGVLCAEVDESLHAVGYFAEDFEGGQRGYIYKSKQVAEEYDEESLLSLLKDAFMDSFGAIAYEELHASNLHATTRIYDEFVDVVVPLGETKGVTFMLDRDGEYDLLVIMQRIEEAVGDERLGIDISG